MPSVKEEIEASEGELVIGDDEDAAAKKKARDEQIAEQALARAFEESLYVADAEDGTELECTDYTD